jgi:O-antigen ligase
MNGRSNQNVYLPERSKSRSALIASLVIFILALPVNFKSSLFAIILMGCIMIWRFVETHTLVKPQRFIFCLMLSYLVRVIWVARANDIGEAMKTLENESSLLFLPLIFCFFEIPPQAKRWLAIAYGTMIIGLITFFFMRFYLNFEIAEVCIYDFLQLHFGNAQFNSQNTILTWRSAHYTFLNAMAIYGVNFIINSDNELDKKTIIAGILLTILTALFVAFTGSTIGALMLIMTWVNFFSMRLGLLNRPYLVLFFFVVAAVFLLTIGARYYPDVDLARATMLSIGIAAFKQNPWIGAGTGSITEIMHNKDFEYNFSYSVNHPHNQYLSELLQFGIVGALPFFLFMVLGMQQAVRTKNKLLFSTLILGSILMLVEAPLNSNKGLLPFVFLCCISGIGSVDSLTKRTKI